MTNFYNIIPVGAQPGIQRDGTPYNSETYIDGQYVRFYQNTPKKIGGCELIELGDTQIVTKMYGYTKNDQMTVFLGKSNSVKFFIINKNDFIPTAVLDITPDTAPDLNWNPNASDNMWTFDIYSYTVETETGLVTASYLFAQVCQSRNDMSTLNVGPIFYTDADNPTKLVPVYGKTGPDPEERIPVQVSGGILFFDKLIIAYSNDGVIFWSDSGAPPEQDWHLYSGTGVTDAYPANTNIIANNKIVQGISWRGGMVFWSLDSLISAESTLVTYQIGDDNVAYPLINGNVVQKGISIIAPNSVAQYDQQIFWIGVDKFYTYNGVVQTLENETNRNWFFQNVNKKAAAKIWSTTISEYNEIWWFYPRLPFIPGEGQTMSDQECNAVIIYNVEKKIWYDCTIPPEAPQNGIFPWKRSAGIPTSPNVPYPIWADNTLVKINYTIGERQGRPIFLHEKGTDYVLTSFETFSIPSYFTTKLYNLWQSNPQSSFLLQSWRIVPDFVQNGDMTITINTQNYPNSVILNTRPVVFNNDPETANYKEYIDFSVQAPLQSFTFSSNVLGGDYHAGRTELYFNQGDPLK